MPHQPAVRARVDVLAEPVVEQLTLETRLRQRLRRIAADLAPEEKPNRQQPNRVDPALAQSPRPGKGLVSATSWMAISGVRGDQLQQAPRELLEVWLGEMAVECLAVRPFLDGDEAQRVLHGREESVAQTPLLAARVVLHLLELGDELLPLLSKTLDATDNQHHA